MAAINRFYIGQLTGTGLQSDLKPYAIPDDAFAELNNAYVFRGRVRKRFGGQLMRGTQAQIAGLEQIQSRFKIKLDTTDVAGAYSGIIPGQVLGVGIAFSVIDPVRTGTPNDNFFTVYQNGAMYSTGSATGTYNTATGAVSITGAAASADVYFYPSQPVMGLCTYQVSAISDEQTIGFDTQFAYKFGANGWDIAGPIPPTAGGVLFTGDNSKFFWSNTWIDGSDADYYMFVTNYNTGADLTDSDKMYYWDGTSWGEFNPGFNSGTATDTILSARIIVTFHNRLVLLNVVENTGAGPGANTTYSNRIRYSWDGSPVATAAFYDDTGAGGGYLDCPTKEAIITAQFLKDRLIVYFESSTWELVYKGNQVEPFVWQQINTELGAESTFSQVPFDKIVLGVGNVGIHACSGYNVERIDSKIPDEVFRIHNDNNGIERVAGIRDYYTEMVYWTFPSENQSSDFPYCNRVLTYNYKTGAWGFNDDSITAFGYFQNTVSQDLPGLQWQNANMSWQEANMPWVSAILQARFRNVIAGNQEGYTFIVNPDLSSNCPALQITDIPSVTSTFIATLTIINHNLSAGDYIKISNCQGITDLNGLIFQVVTVTNANTVVIDLNGISVTGTYTGAGTVTRVTPIDFKTKQFNFYAEQGRNAYISKVDFLVDSTESGECVVDFLIGSSDYSMITQNNATNSIVGTSILETSPYVSVPFEAQQVRLWHPVYFLAEGEYVQFHFYLNHAQSIDVDIAEEDFQLHALIINSTPTSYRLQ